MKNNKILLALMPFWDPLIPPQGIAHIKNFLERSDYVVKTLDANTEEQFKEIYNKYFALLKKYIPGNKQGNFFNIGHDVMRNHMTAHIHAGTNGENQYRELVKIIIHNTFYTSFNDLQIDELNHILTEFYCRLKKYILEKLAREEPGVFGLSVPRDTIGPSMFAFRTAKETYPSIKTVMGGSIFSDQLWKDTPNFKYFVEKTPYIDKIIIGKGEHLLLKWLQGLLPETQKVFPPEDIGDVAPVESSSYLPDLTDFNIQRDYPYLAAQASSSCPYQCSFCNVKTFFGEYRKKDPNQTVQEMTALYKKYGLQLFFMNDALLNPVIDELSEAFIRSELALYWDGYLRVDDAITEADNTLKWRQGGFYRARLGVESGSQHVLDLIHKGITPALTKKTLFSLANAGIKTTAYWVIGHPGETEDDFLQTLEFLEEVKDYIYEAECNPFIYGYSGQSDTAQWKDRRKLLYPESTRELMVLESWYVEEEPSRKETYQRINRFVQQCYRLGIPNPYSLHDIYKADKRWKGLHKNAVPPLALFKEKHAYIDECKQVKKIFFLENFFEDEGDFDF